MLLSLILTVVKVYTLPRLPVSWLNNLTERRVLKTVHDAYRNVPFYHLKYDDAGVDMRRIRCLDDLKMLPVLTKQEVRQNYPDGLVKKGVDIDKCHRSATSGSTGKPLSFIIGTAAYNYYLAESARIYSMIGYRPWQRTCYLRYAPMDLPGVSSRKQRFISSTAPVFEQIDMLKTAKPHLIDAYASTMLDITRHVTTEDVKKINPKIITVNSEMSTIEEREYISRVFGCPVYDEYSSEETWGIAAQCRKKSYHIFTDSVWLEFLDSDGEYVKPNETGEIVITTTRSDAMPFIRYAIGDKGRPGKGTCGCGYNLPRMESIEGRADDWLVMTDGRLEPSRILCVIGEAIQRCPHLFNEYKVVQKTIDQVVLQYTQGRDFQQALLEEIIHGIQALLNENMAIAAEEVCPTRGIKRQALESWVYRGSQ